MRKEVSYCPLCGGAFDQVADSPDPRASSGYQCDNCDEVLEIRVNQFPMA